MPNDALSESFDSGFGSLTNAWNVPGPVNGQVTLTGSSAMMEWATGPASGHGYGTYTVTAKAEGSQPGPGIILWPGDNQWPGQEIDMLELTPDGSGRQYGTMHWNNNGHDAYATVLYNGVQTGQFHDYQMIWEPGKLTFKVDGKEMGGFDSNVPVDFDHGGMNNTIGFMNNNPSTSLTVSHVDFTPLGETVHSTPAPVATPVAEAAPATASVVVTASAVVDWDALAAQVSANFAATGRWELPGETAEATPHQAAAPVAEEVHSTVVDWNALAAQVTANFEATGAWFY